MTRRNLLLASATPPPTTELQFPVYLVEGDNGQLGTDFYNHVIERGHNNEEVYVIKKWLYSCNLWLGNCIK